VLDVLSHDGCTGLVTIDGLEGQFATCEGAGANLADPGGEGPGSLVRVPDGADTDRNQIDFRLSTQPTPCARNELQ